LSDLLYLDTARLGRISPSAQRAERALISLAAEEGNSAYFEQFVRHGIAKSPLAAKECYSGLSHWAGVGELKQSLRTLAGHRPDLPVLIAHRSAQLMKLAARALFHSCRNVLITDLGWPGYHDILACEAGRANRGVTTVEVRTEVLSGWLGEGELIDRVCEAFVRKRCDGLFLSAVSNWGVKLPVEPIVRRLEEINWFVVVDGAQEFCHIPGRLETEYCDLYLTGCHKWLGAHHPMGLGFYGRRRSCKVIDTIVADMTATADLDDPLLRFSGLLESCTSGVTETVNLLPLFTARAAVEDAQLDAAVSRRAENIRVAAAVAGTAGWRPLLPDEPLRSGILLLKAERPAARTVCPEALRTTLRDGGIAATAYEGGIVRLSMPLAPFTPGELDCLGQALRRAS
jgi:selenocysteine lyase/cysteine desulfurase